MANYSFSHNEGELHLYNCQLQHRGYEVRRSMSQEGYLLNTSCCMSCLLPTVVHFILSVYSFLIFMFEPVKSEWALRGVW
jgi:hypothetical protein